MRHVDNIRRIAATFVETAKPNRYKKNAERAEIERHVDEFLTNGGTITAIPRGTSNIVTGPQGITVNAREDNKLPRPKPKHKRKKGTKK